MVKKINLMGKAIKIIPLNVTIINRHNLMGIFHGTLMGILTVVYGSVTQEMSSCQDTK